MDFNDRDENPNTDRFVLFAWQPLDFPSSWPGTFSQTLATVHFAAAVDFTGVTEIHLVTTGGPPNFIFVGESATIHSSALCPPGIDDCQVLTPNPLLQSVVPGASFSLDVDYEATSAGTGGVSVDVFYDSSKMTFDGFSNVFPSFLLGTSELADSLDVDGDPNTDRRLAAAWADSDPPPPFRERPRSDS